MKRKLKKLGQKADPDKEFVQRLERLLVPEARNKPFWFLGWRMAAVPTLVVVLAVGTTGTYAYASDNVLPGHPLYPVKQSLEKVEEKAAVKPQTKLLVEIKHLGRRLQEDKTLLNRHKNLPQARLKDFQAKLQALMDQVGKLPEKQRPTLDRELGAVAAGFYTFKTDVTNAGLDAQTRQDIDKLFDASDQTIESKIESMDAKRKESFKTVEDKIKLKAKK